MKLLFLLLSLTSSQVFASKEKLTIAVASNFAAPMKKIVEDFEKTSSIKVNLVFSSSGKIYHQIIHGAPYDLFFSADEKHPKKLVNGKFGIKESRRTYAIGQLILWSQSDFTSKDLSSVLSAPHVKFIAISNPKLAPYGFAAKQVLKNLKLEDKLKDKIVTGENVAQAFHFAKTGNAQLAFVAKSQFIDSDGKGTSLELADNLYAPIVQQYLLLTESNSTKEFLSYFHSKKSQNLIKLFGYKVPNYEP